MTQGDQNLPSGKTAACSSCPKDADAAERGSNSPLEEGGRTVMDSSRPQHVVHVEHNPYLRPDQTTGPADGDVRTLLHFVNLASSDIKAALDKSAPSSKKVAASSGSENHRKCSPKQQKHGPPLGFSDAESYHAGVGGDSVPGHVPGRSAESGFTSRRFAGNLNSPPSSNPNGALHFSERLMASASLHRDHLIKNSDLNLVREFNFGNNYRRDPDQLLGSASRSRGSNRYTDRHSAASVCREFTDLSTLQRGEGDRRGDQDNPVPLRKRRLPASFWQEPDRSENHRTSKTGTSTTGPSPINLTANMKFPLLSTMSQSYADSRPTSLDKNAIYPPSDQCYPTLNLPFPPSLSNSFSGDSYLSRALNLQCSPVCSCHQHAELYGYDHGPACAAAAYALRHGGGETHSMFTPGPLGSSGLFPRWPHVPTPLGTDRADICHSSTSSSIPRVLKPIPTKSITSYPPRYHPIYT